MDLKNKPNIQVEVREVETMEAYGLRHLGPYPEIGTTFGKLMPLAGQQGLPMNDCVAFYYDDPSEVPPEDLKSDAALLVPVGYTGSTEGLTRIEVPAGKYAVGRFVGAYSGLYEAWQWLFREGIPGTGHKPAHGIEFERYILHDEAHPENCITDIYIPVE